MRIVSRLIALALALGLVVGGVLVAVEIVIAEIGRAPWVIPYDQWYESARTNAWSSTSTRQLALVLAVAGLLLLLLQLARRRPRALALETGSSDHTADLHRRDIERSLVRAVTRVDGVSSATAKISNSRTRITASSTRRLPGDLEARVKQAAEQRMAAFKLASPPALSVTLHSPGPR
ncbi:MAG: hypothetical protein H0U41_01725 [Actinobacteria bacterium]|nr:hypothetical protein [Actinomycetota bacterium]